MNYEVIIIGAGVTGSAILYVLSNYTNVNNIAIVEKYSKIAQVNSQKDNNSQTLHFGDIETNYTLEKAKIVNRASAMTKKYLEKNESNLFKKFTKMVLAVGKEEVNELEKRYDEFKNLFPELKKISKEDIAKIEPKIVEKRDSDENILALFSENGYAVDFGKLSESFVKNSLKTNKNIDVYLNTEVIKIEKKEKGYTVVTGKNILKANVVVVATAGHSLLFAHSLGYGKKYILLPVAGSFFKAEKMLNGKVYTMQIKKLPFAAIHGDPDILNSEETRFGPTAKVLPMLERYHYRTVFDFFKLFEVRLDAILALIKILSDKIIFKYVLKNFIYDIPLIGKIAFLKQVRKIIPSIKLNQLKYLKKVGGIRPQIVDVVDKKLEFGESKIIGENIIFDITPSPGASTCLSNAEKNTKKIVEFFGNKYKFNREKFMKDFDK